MYSKETTRPLLITNINYVLMGVLTTKHRQMLGRPVQESNVCTVLYNDGAPLSSTNDK